MKTKIILIILGLGLFISGWWIGTIKLRKDVYTLMLNIPADQYGEVDNKLSPSAQAELKQFYKDIHNYSLDQSLVFKSRILWEAKYAFQNQILLSQGLTNKLNKVYNAKLNEFLMVSEENGFEDFDFKPVADSLTERIKNKNANQRVDPTVKTPVESGKVQGTAGHPERSKKKQTTS